MATNKTKPNKGVQLQYSTYQSSGKFAKNKARKLARHLKKHPNDTQAKEASKSVVFTRKKPTTKLGWLSELIKREVMVVVPYLNSKGSPIVVRSPDQMESVFRTFGQAVPVTKNEAMKFAQVAKFLRKSPYRLNLVPVKTKEGIDFQWKHISVPFTKV